MDQLPESIEDIDPNKYYSPIDLATLTILTAKALHEHLRNKTLIGSKPDGGRHWHVKGIDFIDWFNNDITGKLGKLRKKGA